MKRAFLIMLKIILLGNFCGFFIFITKYGFPIEINSLIRVHFDISLFSLKIGVIAVLADWYSKHLFVKDEK